MVKFSGSRGPTSDNLVEYLLCGVFLLCGRKTDVIPALKVFRLQWGRQIGTQEIAMQTSLDQATRDGTCFIWGIINVCVEAGPDLGLCSQLPITKVSGSTEGPWPPSAFCCPGLHSLPAGSPMLGNTAEIPGLFTEGRGAHKARYEMWPGRTNKLKTKWFYAKGKLNSFLGHRVKEKL